MVEKIAQRHALGLAPGQRVRSGDYIEIRPVHVMTHDNTGAVIPKFLAIMGADAEEALRDPPPVADPTQPVFAIDHDVQNTSPENLAKYARIERFARAQGIAYHPPGRGIAHQVMVEEGFAAPGRLVVGSDSHSNLYGAVAALGTPVVRTDAAALWAVGSTWWQIPPVTRVVLDNALRPGVTGKDVIITLCGAFNNDEVLNHAVEFAGEGVASLSVDERMTIANMTTEWGALAGVFPFDQRLRDFLLKRARFFQMRHSHGGPPPRYSEADVERWWSEREAIHPDPAAAYAQELTLDLATVSPHVSGPNEVKTMRSAHELARERIRIDKAYLMSCVNARLSDLEQAAQVLRGGRVAEGVELYLAAASSLVQEEAERNGVWQTLLEAGAIALPPGCGACIGLGKGTLEAGEVGVSATNRNFQGRMGSRDALCYLASPAVVAASARAGHICAPQDVEPVPLRASRRLFEQPADDGATQTAILEGFPRSVKGRILFLPKDNLNTDGMYGKDVTYRDDITFEQQGQYAMLNYDPAFQEKKQAGDILVGGRNFGCGSSREQAATALASAGIQLVVAASFSQTYKRNAFNNGLLCVDCPALVDHLRRRFADRVETERTIVGPQLRIDFARSVAELEDEAFPIGPISPVAQELIVAGGSEALVQRRLASRSGA